MRLTYSWVALCANTIVNGQFSGWFQDQVNTTLCRWPNLRVSAIKDTVYMDGGIIYWAPGLSNGTYRVPTPDDNTLALVYKLNFSKPFNTTADFNYTTLLEHMPKGGSGNAGTNIAPNYQDGAMLANDHEFFLYGGAHRQSAIYKPQAADDVLGYRLSQYIDSATPGQFFPGAFNGQLPPNITRYVTYGAAANAPSEQKAWYVGGMRSASSGPLFTMTYNETFLATNASQHLITLDMTRQNFEKWSNVSIPPAMMARANPEAIWVPVGEQGILAVVGGVTFPSYSTGRNRSVNPGQSQIDSPKFMQTIDIYDVASNKWFKQATSGDAPGQLAQGCAVLATAEDYSSFNIYWYGGFPALEIDQNYEDTVWVLSLPSFTWTKLATGTPEHARIGHKCVRPYPDQMMVIGGQAQNARGTIPCLDGAIQVFNLTSAQWISSYDPSVYMSSYRIPEMVVQVIGGTSAGGATQSKPKVGGWDDPKLGEIFAKPYNKDKLTTYFPYAVAPGPPPGRTDIVASGSGLPSWVAPVLGVVLGLVFLSALIVAVMLYRRRKLLRNNGGTTTVSTADDNGGRIMSWIRGQHSEKAPTVMTEDTTLHLNDLDTKIAPMVAQSHATGRSTVATHEAPDNTFYEMADTSRRHELSDTGLTPVEHTSKHSHFGRRPPYPSNRSGSWQSGGAAARDHARSVSPPNGEHPDSPPPGTQPISNPSSGSLALGGPGGASAVHSSAGSMTAPAAAGLPPFADQQQYQPQHHEDFQELDAGQTRPPPQQEARSQQPSSTPNRNTVISGISALSEQDRTHLRHLSASTVSSATATMPNSAGLVSGFQQHQQHDHDQTQLTSQTADYTPVSPSAIGTMDTRGFGDLGGTGAGLPVSPPTAEEREGVDYLTSQPVRNQPERRSVFHEQDTGDVPPTHGGDGQQQRH
ncbi:hypothetical protein Micbo1qcDRAFT_162603 [Microdochium bolleyi]|uniref:Galactose oxidase/kelch, beta-propeller n=1 Tax=Microdochium bolleyi TaxID=196109 RepID=A0A136J5C2_9PEZI|nr:hypothetical protein Micbo1qcDRAFT_162603 [Microdochium bolleyi]